VTRDADPVRVGRVEDFPLGRGRRVKLPGETVAVFRLASGWFALQDSCPHMGASLADGRIEDGAVVCHWHGWRFDLRSGQGDMRRWACARVYGVRVEGGEVLLEPPPEPATENRPEDEAEEDWIRWDAERFLRKKPDDS